VKNASRAVAQVVSSRPLTVEARVYPQVIPREICGGHSGTGSGLSVFPPLSIHQCHTLTVTYMLLLSEGQPVQVTNGP